MTKSAVNTVRFNDQLRAHGVNLSHAEMLQTVSEILKDMPVDTQPIGQDEVKRQARILGETLRHQGRQLKHMKCLEALARLHGARNWHAIRFQISVPAELTVLTELTMPAQLIVPARPVLDVMMGVQGLTDEQTALARAILEARITVLLARYDAADWTVTLTLDATPSAVVRANTELLQLDTPDDEVSDYADMILPDTYTAWPPEQLQGDVMAAILRARGAAQKELAIK